MNTLCQNCPGHLKYKMRHFKNDTVAKRAMAWRLNIYLHESILEYHIWKANPWLPKLMTPKQIERMERSWRKRINSIKVVIWMLEGYKGKEPAMTDDVPDNVEVPDKKKNY